MVSHMLLWYSKPSEQKLMYIHAQILSKKHKIMSKSEIKHVTNSPKQIANLHLIKNPDFADTLKIPRDTP